MKIYLKIAATLLTRESVNYQLEFSKEVLVAQVAANVGFQSFRPEKTFGFKAMLVNASLH